MSGTDPAGLHAELADQFMSGTLDDIGAFEESNDEQRDRADVRAGLIALLAGAYQRGRTEALTEAADAFAARLPDGAGNGRAYNSWRVAQMLRDRAATGDDR